MTIAVMGRDGMDDMIYCSNNCGVARCLHHPSQVDNPETPHQFAHLHHTDYCPLWRQEIEKVEVVRCKDCVHNKRSRASGNANCELYYGMTDQMGFCHMGEKRDV